jgi:ribonuclease R
MLSRDIPTLFRHHPAPEDLSQVWETLQLLGVKNARRMGLRRATAKAARMGFGPTIAAAVFRCMPRAGYSTERASHFSLAFDAYLHFTSPIRRYADLVVHRSLHQLLRDRRKPLSLPPDSTLSLPRAEQELEALGQHINNRAAAAERAESRARRRRVLAFLLRQGAIPTTGQITGVVEKGLFVDLTEYGTSGFLNAELLPGGPYTFTPGALANDHTSYCLGQEIEVSIHRIDPTAGQLDLILAPCH